MKARLAKKIMKQEPNPMGKSSWYWFDRWVDYHFREFPDYKTDHRIEQAIRITKNKQKK